MFVTNDLTLAQTVGFVKRVLSPAQPTSAGGERQARRSSRTLPGRTPHACDDSSVHIEIGAVPTSPRASIRAAQLDHSEIAAIPAQPYSAGGGATGALIE
jgi:hypothetical protein